MHILKNKDLAPSIHALVPPFIEGLTLRPAILFELRSAKLSILNGTKDFEHLENSLELLAPAIKTLLEQAQSH